MHTAYNLNEVTNGDERKMVPIAISCYRKITLPSGMIINYLYKRTYNSQAGKSQILKWLCLTSRIQKWIQVQWHMCCKREK